MAKQATPKLSVEQVSEIFKELKKLEPPKKPSLSEILAENKDVIIDAFKKGNSLRDIATFLTNKGLKTSHETLRKVAENWGIISKKTRQNKENEAVVKHD